jgi:hypothetical protein
VPVVLAGTAEVTERVPGARQTGVRPGLLVARADLGGDRQRVGMVSKRIRGLAGGSTADSLDDVRGPSVCIVGSGSAGEGVVVSGAVCASFADSDLDEVTSVSVVAGPGFGASLDAPNFGDGAGALQVGYTGVTELPWLESAVEGTVNYVDEATGWRGTARRRCGWRVHAACAACRSR